MKPTSEEAQSRESPSTYLDPAAQPFAFCPGCSHSRILEKLDEALVALQLDPQETVLVTDIGCAGISDKYFRTHSFHGLHGRSVTYATGIKLANPHLNVIVLIGDGGCGIGGHHLLNAARRNVGISVIVFNNLNFGMTGGQYSVTTPPDSITSTTPYGHLESPLDIAGTVAVNGAGFAARTTAYDPELRDLLARAIAHEGFSLVDVWELCVAYYVPRNQFSRSSLEQAMADLGLEQGLVQLRDRPEYSASYRRASQAQSGEPTLAPRPLESKYTSSIDQPLRVVIAGSAGQRIRTAGSLLATGAVLSGLWATRRDDYPITVRSGHSLAEVILSPSPIEYTGAGRPDVVAVLAPEGAHRMRSAIASMAQSGRVFSLADIDVGESSAPTTTFQFGQGAKPHLRKSLSTLAIGYVVRSLDLFPMEALREAARRSQSDEIAKVNLSALDSLDSASPPKGNGG